MRIREDFAAAGGCSTGKVMAGVDPADVVGVEKDAAAVETARAAGHRRLHMDVREARGLDWGALDGYSAGPPCQTFSMAGKGNGRDALAHLIRALEHVADGMLPERAIERVHDTVLDERSLLVLEPLLVARRHRPTWILLEQVPTVLPVWQAYAELLRDRFGYHVETGILHAEQYGVPQTRKRAILLAHLERPVALPTPTHSRFYPRNPSKLDPGVQKWVSMAEALGWTPDTRVVSNYGTGGDPRNRNVVYWEMGDVRSSKGCIRPVEQPSPSITSSMDNGNFQWRNAQVSTRVTVQEAAVLQSFPPDYPWQGSKTKQYQQVGNACPPLLSAVCVRQLLDQKKEA